MKPILEQLEDRVTPSGYDPGLLALAITDFNRDHAITRPDTIGLFNLAASESPTVTALQLSTFQALMANATAAGMTPATTYLASQVLSGLTIGTQSATLTAAVDQWFLGTTLPTTPYPYATFSGSLFGPGGPSPNDVAQGNLGDCFVLSALAEIALRRPQTIRDMFADNGDGTWTVRLYTQVGQTMVAQYVTVDNRLPTIGGGNTAYAHVLGGVLWVALAEKAYAQFSGGSYANIVGMGGCLPVEKAVTGNINSQPYNPYYAQYQPIIVAAVQAGQIVTMETTANPGAGIVPNHAYYAIAYDPATGLFTLGNPYGPGVGVLHLNWPQIQSAMFNVDVCP